MNNFIAACLVLPLLLAFVMQYGLQIKNNYNISEFQTIVEAAKEEAKQEGYFTSDITDQLKTDIEQAYKDVEPGEIVINVTSTPKYRINTYDERELINYEIGVPIDKVIAANKIWGIKDEDNDMIYYLRGSIASEKLLPEDETI